MRIVKRTYMLVAAMFALATFILAQDANRWQIGERFVFQKGYGPSEYFGVGVSLDGRYNGTTATIISIDKCDSSSQYLFFDARGRCVILKMRAELDGTVFDVKPDGRLVLVNTDQGSGLRTSVQPSSELFGLDRLADVEAGLVKRKASIDALRSAFKGKTFWFRHNRYAPLKCVDVLASDSDERKAKAQEAAKSLTNVSSVSNSTTTPMSQLAPTSSAKKVTVQVTYDENGRVTQASGGDATQLRIAKQKRFPAGKAGSATITIPINSDEKDNRNVVGAYSFDEFDELPRVKIYVYSLATLVFETASGEHVTRTVDNEKEPFAGEVFFTRDPRQIFPARVWTFIERGKVFVGMTKDQALASWGRPEHVNKTVTRGGVSEQWVYGLSTYLYFTNGRLTAAQN